MNACADLLRELTLDPQSIPGFLTVEEGEALCCRAKASRQFGPIVEIGSYCGRSTVYLAAGAAPDGVVVSIDHHRGSEEHQPGGGFDDPRFWDADIGAVDTLPTFRRSLRRAGIENRVIAMVGSSPQIGRIWSKPIGLLFIDGGHSLRAAMNDWRVWAPFVAPGGALAIHDVFPKPADGGRPPHEIYRFAIRSGLFEPIDTVGHCAFLRRVAGD